MSGPLQLIITTTPKTDDASQFLSDLGTDVQNNEPDTLDYRFFQSNDGTCIFHDIYASSAAFVSHFGRLQKTGAIEDWLANFDIKSVDCLGTPDDEAREMLDGFGAIYYGRLGGFSRVLDAVVPA